MSQGTLERDIAPEADESAGNGLGRALLRVVILSVVVTTLVAGVYLLLNGRPGTDPLATQGTTPITAGQPGEAGKPGKAGKADAGQVPPAAPPTFEQTVAAGVAKLADVPADERRTALIKYAEKSVGMKITAKQSPATAATAVCDLLADGMSPKKLQNEFARGNDYTMGQNRAFLLGATTLYCSGQAKNFV